tara:strand:+ start:832 stop:1026 length:195 start_codon:yes stop_codon:yes gene_type:complete
MFLNQDVRVVGDLDALFKTKAAGQPCEHFYGIGGCGGQVLAYMHDRFSHFITFTGIDLGVEQIE